MKYRKNDISYLGCRADVITSANPTLNVKNKEHFYDYVTERYRILKRRERGLPRDQWTENPILQTYSFTNVRREHDKTSKWLIDHISNNLDLSIEERFFQTFMFRLYNRIDTAELFEMGSDFTWDDDRIRECLKRDPNPGRDYYTRAYRTVGLKRLLRDNYESDMHIKGYAYLFIKDIYNQHKTGENSCPLFKQGNFRDDINAEDIFNYFVQFKGIANFMGYQLFVDTTYINECPVSENEFVVCGPGCIDGINRLFDDRDGMTYEETIFWVRDNIDDLFESIDPKFEGFYNLMDNVPEYDRTMNVMSIENCFCEFSKYMWSASGEGAPRRKYKG